MFLKHDEFKDKEINILHLYLDPNNPRFIEEKTVTILEKDIIDDTVQQEALNRIRKYGIPELIESIKNVGFVPIDRIVVKEIIGFPDEYVVLEGNRRLASLIILNKLDDKKELPDVSEEVIKTIKNIGVVVYSGDDPDIAWIIQGLRHISGVRDWRPYQQAVILDKLVEDKHVSILDASKAVGIDYEKGVRFLNALQGFKQAQSNKLYGPFLKPEHFAYFNEVVFRRVALSKWLNWDEESRTFKNEENFTSLLSWFIKKISEDGDEEEKEDPRIKSARELRDIVVRSLINETDLFRKWTIDENMSVSILQFELGKRSRSDEEEWYDRLINFTNDIEDLSTVKIIPKKDRYLPVMKKLVDLLNVHIELLE